MNGSRPSDPKAIRLVFELARADNPRLFDELSRFSQGSKRVNRLRVLAYDGLLVQYGVLALGMSTAVHKAVSTQVEIEQSHVTDELFQPGLSQ
jgi:hypothetical protein